MTASVTRGLLVASLNLLDTLLAVRVTSHNISNGVFYRPFVQLYTPGRISFCFPFVSLGSRHVFCASRMVHAVGFRRLGLLLPLCLPLFSFFRVGGFSFL